MTIVAALAGALVMTAALADTSAEGQAAYQKRDDTMKLMGRNLYGGVGRVVKGTIKYSPATVTAAETAQTAAAALPTLFPPGSDAPKSKMKPDLPGNKADIDALSAKVQAALAALVPAVKTADPATIAAAFKTADDACDACHMKYRND
jgi:cytochrome c556